MKAIRPIFLFLFVTSLSFAQNNFNTTLIEHNYNWYVKGFALKDNVLYTSWINRIASFDVSNPERPVFIDSVAWADFIPGDEGVSLKIMGDYLYVSTGLSGIRIMDISDPYHVKLHGSYDSRWGYFYHLDDILYHRRRGGGDSLVVYDSSTYGTLSPIAKYYMPYSSSWPYSRHTLLQINSDTMFIGIRDTATGDESFSRWFIQPEGRLSLDYSISIWDIPSIPNLDIMFVHDTILYSRSRTKQLDVYSIFNIEQPKHLIQVPGCTGFNDLQQHDSLLYGLCDEGVLYVYDVSTPSNPITIAYYKDKWLAPLYGMRIIDNYVYASSAEGLTIIRIGEPSSASQPASPSSLSLSPAYPNPFTTSTTISYTLPSQESITLEVYDMLGRNIRTLYSGRQEPGSHSAQLRAEGMPAGMYRVVLRGKDGMKSQTVVVR